MMNQEKSIDPEGGKNDDLGGTRMMKMRDDHIAQSVIAIEMIDSRIDEREGILAAVVLMKDQEKDTIT